MPRIEVCEPPAKLGFGTRIRRLRSHHATSLAPWGAGSRPGLRVRPTAAAVAVAACSAELGFEKASGEQLAVLLIRAAASRSGGVAMSGPPNRGAGTAPALLPHEHRELHPGLDHVRHTVQ